MDNFIGTVAFILPGFLMYFWIQSFGVNPVVKHSPAELGAISGLLWIPVSVTTIIIYNLLIKFSISLSSASYVWSLDDLKKNSSSFLFLFLFLILSIFVSLLMSYLYVKYIYPLQSKLINKVRTSRGLAAFSNTPSVWEEVFANNDSQVVEIGRIDKQATPIIGCISKASRTFEPERNLHLNDVDFFRNLVEKHKISVNCVFYDTKSGSYVKIFDAQQIRDAQLKDLKEAKAPPKEQPSNEEKSEESIESHPDSKE